MNKKNRQDNRKLNSGKFCKKYYWIFYERIH